MMNLPKKVTIVDVGPRDGFQMEPGFIPTEHKIKIIDRLSETGIKRIEATSFVHPKYVPQLADAEEVLSRIKKKKGVIYEALVPNAKGVERAIKAGVEHVSLVVSASESHNKANVNMTISESVKTLKEAVALARSHGIAVTAGVATAFGCAIEGWVPPEQVEAVADEFLGLGVCELSLGDTPGLANPVQVSEMVRRLGVEYGKRVWCPNIVVKNPDRDTQYSVLNKFALQERTGYFHDRAFKNIRNIFRSGFVNETFPINYWTWNDTYPERWQRYFLAVDNGIDWTDSNAQIQETIYDVPVFGG